MIEVRVPVIRDREQVFGYPKRTDSSSGVEYVELGEALVSEYTTDAHVAAYSHPTLPHRLTRAALAYPELAGGVAMVLFIVDVDHPRHGEEPDTDEGRAELASFVAAWRESEQVKLERLRGEDRGVFVYFTRGGYRLIWRLSPRHVIRTQADEDAWSLFYRRCLLHLFRCYGIEGDPACADWPHLFRLPHATRPKSTTPERLSTRGDAHHLGAWTHLPTAAELPADIETARALFNRGGKSVGKWDRLLRLLAPPTPGVGQGGRRTAADQTRDDVYKRAAGYLGKMPPSIQGDGGSSALMAAAVAMRRGFNLDHSDAVDLLTSEFNPRCDPPWQGPDIERKVHEAERVGRMEWGKLRDAEGGEAGRKFKPGERRQRAAGPTRNTTTNGSERMSDDQGAAGAADQHDQADEKQGPVSGTGPRSARTEDPARFTVEITNELQKSVDAAIVALSQCEDLYTRGLSLAQVVTTIGPEGEGTPVLRPLPRPTLREMLCAAATWKRFDSRKGGMRRVMPTDAILQAVEARGRWPDLRPVVGVARTPFLRADGSVCDRQGYDQASGYVLACDEAFPPIPERPTQADARAALAAIVDLFTDFPCVDDASRHVPAAALLTILSMPALGDCNVPAFLIEATTPGTGKGLMLDVVSILATGRAVPKSAWRENEEMEKVLGAAALEGASLLAFDNISPRLPFGGSAVDLVLTCSGQYKPRVLGKSEAPTLPWRAVILATGNNITIEGDTRRRVLLCRQRSRLERPEERDDFKYPHLRAEARQRRPELVAAALTVLRAHAVAGRPAAVRRVGSFEEWGSMVASAIAWASGVNVLDAMPRSETSDDPVLSALQVLLEAWPTFDPSGRGLRLATLADRLYPESVRPAYGGPPVEPAETDGQDHVRDALQQLAPVRGGGRVRFDPRALGLVLRAHRGRNLGGRAFEEGKLLHGSKTWKVVDALSGEPIRNPEGVGVGGAGGVSTSYAGANRKEERSANEGGPGRPNSTHSTYSHPEDSPTGGEWAQA